MVTVQPEPPGDADAVRGARRVPLPTDAKARLVDQAAHRRPGACVARRRGGRRRRRPRRVQPGDGRRARAGRGWDWPRSRSCRIPARGIGSALVREGLSVCRGRGRVSSWSWGTLHTTRGSASAGPTRSGWATRRGGRAFMVLELRPGALPGQGGLVKYGREFAEWE